MLFGKYDSAMGLRYHIDIWIKGYRFLGRKPLSAYSMRRLMYDEPLRHAAFGAPEKYSSAPQAPLSQQDLEAIVRRYRPAAVPMCSADGSTIYLNFLVRRDLIPGTDEILLGS